MTEAEPSLSVVLPVHAGAHPEHLRVALDSIYAQTRPASEVVVVEDGPLPAGLREVIDSFGSRRRPELRRVVLPENRGRGAAAQAGLLAARQPWVARMDSDDISLPERFERQMEVLRSGRHDVVGTAMAEFEHDPSAVTAIRGMPVEHDEIAARMRMNSPVNHPTVVFRRSLALAVGGYRDLRVLEDYDLFARLLAHGARFHNLPEPLVLFRADASMYRRRRSEGFLASEWRLQRALVELGIIGRVRMAVNLLLRLAFRALPTVVLRRAYRLLFLRPARPDGSSRTAAQDPQ